jgi:integrase
VGRHEQQEGGEKRKSPYWYFKAPRPGCPGKYDDVSTRKKKVSEAHAYRADYLKKLTDGLLPDARAKWTLAQALKQELEFRASTRRSSSAAPNQSMCKNLLRVLGGATVLKKLASVSVIERYQITRSQEGRVGKTVNNEVNLLAAVLNKAGLWNSLKDRIKPLPVEKQGPGKALTPQEGQQLFSTAKTKDAWFVALCTSDVGYSTGCRKSEIASLQLRDIDLNPADPAINIRRENAKNDGSSRRVSLNDHALWAVRQLLRRAELIGAVEPHHFLLPAPMWKHTRQRDPLRGRHGYDPTSHQKSWDSAWNSLRKAAGLPGFRFHDLRHTFITHAVMADTSIDFVMAQVGHLSPEMTRRYLHLTRRAAQNTVRNAQAYNQGLGDVLGEAGNNVSE